MSYSPPPPGYEPPGAYPAPQRTSTTAIISLITGILGVFPCCTVGIFSIAAIILGVLGKKETAGSAGSVRGEGMAIGGLTLGIVGLVLGVTYWVLVGVGVIDLDVYAGLDS
ncbi:DUF4190 domain-containing protein [Nocardioides sp. GXZ039]|uniref:DUF4190 domain-containing protein n=1 Tax=Nocardioides sp. GXZ039 TaxID=3136018 RepID=UPI0030F3E838